MSKKKIIAIITIIVLLFAAGISVGVFLYGRGETEATDGNQKIDQGQVSDGNQTTGGTQTDEKTTDAQNPGGEHTIIPGEDADGEGDNETVENDNENANNQVANNNNVAGNVNNATNTGNNNGVTTDTNVGNVGETTISRVEEKERLISEDFLDWWQPMTVAVKPTEVGVKLPQITVKKAAITQVGDAKLVYIGQDITYVIAVTNNSETTVENIEITDRIPENTTYVADSIEDAFILREVDGKLTSEIIGTKSTVEVENKVVGVKWIVSIPAGETVIAKFTVNVNKTMINENQEEVETTGTILNTAIANGEESNEVQTSIIRTHKSSVITRLNEETQQYEIVETAKIGDLITYTISIENTGDVEGTTYIIDEVPDGTQFVSAQEEVTVSEAKDSIVWSVTVPAHTIITREFTVEVISVDGLIRNVATVGGTPTNEDIIDTANIDVVKTATAVKRAGEDEFTTPVGSVKENDIIQYTIVVTNTGSRDLTNVLLEEQLDRVEITKLVVDGTEKDIVKDNTTGKLIIGDLKAAKEATEEKEAIEAGVAVITATYTVSYKSEMNNGNEGYKDGTLEFIYNKVRATGETIPKTPEEIPEEVEDNDDETVPVIPDPNFTVEKTALQVKRAGETEFINIKGKKVRPGDIVKYEIVITNTGNTKLTNIEVRDTLDVRVDEYNKDDEPITAGNIIKVIPSLVSGANTTIITYYEVNENDITFGKVNEDDLIEIEVIKNIVTAKPEELEEKEDDEIVPVNPNTLVSGTKTWLDNNNQDGKRPQSITINLLADGNKVDHKVIKESDNWSWSFEKLPVYNGENKITYTISEDSVVEYTTNIDGYNVTNTHIPETTTIQGTKTWLDNNNQDGKRPQSITIRLLANGNEVDYRVVKESDNWSWKFENIPVYANGSRITYTISENQVSGYSTPEINGYNVTNTILQQYTVDISGTKTWYVPNGYNVPNIIIKLYQNGNAFKKANGDDLTFEIKNGAETYEFTGLPKYKIENGKYVIDANGNFAENVYTVSEEEISGFKSEQNGYDFINTIQEKISISGTKIWDDNNNQDGKRPSTITINLWADGVKLNNKPEILKNQDEQGKWTYTFKDLERYSNLGKEITYVVTEETVPGYETPKINRYDITNKHTPEITTIKGTKTWVDGDNKYGKRPTSITVNLLANGTKVDSQKIEPDSNGNWPAYEFKNKPVYSNGKKIAYTITEDAVEAYKTSINGYNLTNTYKEPTGTIKRNWDITSTTASPIPVDVVFVLDTSYSMVQVKDGIPNTRGEDLVKAVNSSIKEILSFNSYNRVSVVGFSEDGMYGDGHNNRSDASVLLSLGRYEIKDKSNKKSYLVKDGDKVTTNVTSYTKQKTRYFEQGTYTQAGIKLGAQQLLNVKDTTVKINDKTTVKRIPMIILVSDGEPTAFTTSFKNPEINVEKYEKIDGKYDVTTYNSKKLGTGQLKNNSAIYGYYTILTANYYKQQVAAHYDTTAKMFTIAMDLTTYYGETVLNPGETQLNTCKTHVEADKKNGLINQIENRNIAQDLYKYLKTTKNTNVTFKEIEKDSKGNVKKNDDGLIYKNTKITINYKNESKYRGSYADKAFKGHMNSTALKNAMIGSITETTANSKEWKLSEITSEEKANCRANLPNIDKQGTFSLVIKKVDGTEIKYTSFNQAFNGAQGKPKVLNGNDTSGYYLDLKLVPAGATITLSYRQK